MEYNSLLAGIAVAFLVGIAGMLTIFAKSAVAAGAAAERQPRERRERRRGALDRMQRGAGAGAGAGAEAFAGADAAGADAGAEAEGGGEDSDDDDDDAAGGERRVHRRQERRAQQQAERQMRNEREAARYDKQSRYSHKQQDRDAERLQKEEDERREREEKEQAEQEEFEKWKVLFAVDVEGEAEPASTDASVVERFLEYVKLRNIVNLEDLAAEFRIRTSAVIDRLERLEKLDRISGIFDDRGRYLYITHEEMQGVADWLQRKGRITRAELVAACNRIIRLNPTEDNKARLQQEAQTAASALDDAADEEEQ